MLKANTKNSAKAPKTKVIKEKVLKTPTAPKYELIAFEVTATIPTQMYGNIMPKISIKAKNI